MKNQFGLRYAQRFFYIQLIVGLCLTLLFGFLGVRAAWSAFLGGIVSILPNLLFARKLFAEQRVTVSKKIIMGFYQGEFMKIAASALLFVVVFLWLQVMPWVFFIAYISMQMMYWFVPLLLWRRF